MIGNSILNINSDDLRRLHKGLTQTLLGVGGTRSQVPIGDDVVRIEDRLLLIDNKYKKLIFDESYQSSTMDDIIKKIEIYPTKRVVPIDYYLDILDERQVQRPRYIINFILFKLSDKSMIKKCPVLKTIPVFNDSPIIIDCLIPSTDIIVDNAIDDEMIKKIYHLYLDIFIALLPQYEIKDLSYLCPLSLLLTTYITPSAPEVIPSNISKLVSDTAHEIYLAKGASIENITCPTLNESLVKFFDERDKILGPCIDDLAAYLKSYSE